MRSVFDLLLRGCHLAVNASDPVVDVGIADGVVGAIEPAGVLAHVAASDTVEAGEGVLLPGLHDHHCHLLATAAALQSVQVGPPDVVDLDGLRATLRDATRTASGWIRAVGYHHSVAGDLDRHLLDAIVDDVPLRVQHRSGARWTLNSAALAAAGITGPDHPSVEVGDAGRPTGRIHRGDAWLRSRLGTAALPDLGALGHRLATYGVTGVTDTTPWTTPAEFDALSDAVTSGVLALRVTVTGGPPMAAAPEPPGLRWGPVKLIIDDAHYPAVHDLASDIDTAHRAGRPVAVHAVTRAAVLVALAAWDDAGARRGDRIEHGSVIPPDVVPRIAALGLTVVTQPGLIGERGDQYLADVDPDDLAHLYPCASLLAAGIAVAAGTDAPYTNSDPWRAIRTAITRRTPSGTVIGAHEAVPATTSVALFLGPPHRPAEPRGVAVGAPADLCVVRPDWLTAPEPVTCTIVGGRLRHRALHSPQP